MKKKPYCIVLVSLSLVLLCLFGFLFFQKTDRSIQITAKSMISGNYLSLYVKGRDVLGGNLESEGYVSFRSDSKLEDFIPKLKESALEDYPNLTMERYESSILFKIPYDENRTDYYCLSNIGNRYCFGGMRANLILGLSDQTERQRKKILLPVHLISDNLILDIGFPDYTLYANVDYAIQGTKEDLISFYQNYGWYDVKMTEDCMTIEEGKFDMKNEKDSFLGLDASFKIHIKEKDGKLQSFSIENFEEE